MPGVSWLQQGSPQVWRRASRNIRYGLLVLLSVNIFNTGKLVPRNPVNRHERAHTTNFCILASPVTVCETVADEHYAAACFTFRGTHTATPFITCSDEHSKMFVFIWFCVEVLGLFCKRDSSLKQPVVPRRKCFAQLFCETHKTTWSSY